MKHPIIQRTHSKESIMKSLITNNTGVSVKSFFVIAVTFIGVFILLVVCFAILWEVIHTNKTSEQLGAFAGIIGAVAGMFATAGITKVIGEKNECKCREADKIIAEDAERRKHAAECASQQCKTN